MIALVFALLLLVSPAYAVEFATVQQASRTTAGTQDFTSSGFGTPKGAMLLITSATATGTETAHALLGHGFMDGTRSVSVSGRSKDGIVLGTTLAGGRGSASDCLLLADQNGTVIVRATCTAITDGIQLNFATAPASALLITVMLVGGSNVSNVYASTITANATINLTASTTAPGFKPTFGIFACYGDNAIDNTNDAFHSEEIGVVVDDGATPPTQYNMSFGDNSGQTSTIVNASMDITTVGRSQVNTAGTEVELTSFDTNGFTITTRIDSVAKQCAYMVVKTSLSVKVMGLDTHTTTGAQSWSGIGFRPQFGLILQGALAAYDSRNGTGNAEVYGIGLITAATQHSVGINVTDGIAAAGTTVAKSVTHTRPIFLRKAGATFIDATFSSFGSGTVNLNYNTADGTVRKWAGLFVGEPSVGGAVQRRRTF